MTVVAETGAGSGVDDVVDAGVVWGEAAEETVVGGVDDGGDGGEGCDVAAP